MPPSEELRSKSIPELQELCGQIRQRILEVVSKNGGHLSSPLGAVELIVGMHAVFDCQENPFIFDVGHQAYAHKLLTGRWEQFDSLRQFGGLSGFPNPKESDLDFFVAGHSSTSISLAVGAAKAFAIEGRDQIPLVLIGDGAMSSGLVYEALNELGERKYPMIILLNDNEMSISKPIGAISRYLSQMIASPLCQSVKGGMKKILQRMPKGASYMAKKFEESFKLITPGIIFEELGLNYIGPIDGHDLEEVIFTLKRAKEMRAPVIIHAQTIKGKGYEIAEEDFEKWHGVSAFDLESGKSLAQPSSAPAPTKVFSTSLQAIAQEDPKVVGITAAMPSGTGMDALMERFPDRFWDVAIAEAHGVTSMASLAKMGFKPFVAIYSTFLQRAYDSLVHDMGLLSLPLRLAIDRAGIVGEDGETHQGMLDIAYLRGIPSMVLFAPRDLGSLKRAVEFAWGLDTSPSAFRYPRGSFVLEEGVYEGTAFRLGEMEVLEEGAEILLLGYGNGVGRAHAVWNLLRAEGLRATLVDLRFVQPLDAGLRELILRHRDTFVLSDSFVQGGVGSAILEMMAEQGLSGARIWSLEISHQVIPHGKTAQIDAYLGLLPEQLCARIKQIKNLGGKG